MVRGVNKNVIEVNCTEHAVFERAILFVKPGCADAGARALQAQAGDYVSSMAWEPDKAVRSGKRRSARQWTLAIVRLLAAAGIGMSVGALFL